MTQTQKASLVMLRDGFGCKNCGEVEKIALPARIEMFSAVLRAAEKIHRRCEPSEAGRKHFEYKNPDEWLESWDTGVSSLTIFGVLAGRSMPDRPDAPHDPDDFGRCYRLLRVAPGWRERLGEVARRFPVWAPLVQNWDELTRLYEEELPTGKAPKLLARLRELRDPCS